MHLGLNAADVPQVWSYFFMLTPYLSMCRKHILQACTDRLLINAIALERTFGKHPVIGKELLNLRKQSVREQTKAAWRVVVAPACSDHRNYGELLCIAKRWRARCFRQRDAHALSRSNLIRVTTKSELL